MVEDVPFVTVVVPTRDRPAALRRCLAGLAAQDYPRDRYEVVVVDDGGMADLEAVVGRCRAVLPVRLARQAPSGPARARNRGAAEGRGTLLAFTDDDCVPEAGWVRALAARLLQRPDALVGGRTVNALPGNLCSAASQLLVDAVSAPQRGETRFVPSSNMALSMAHFEAVGGFADHYALAAGEDRDLCDRWRASGRVIVRAEAVVFHHHELTLQTFWRQHVNYGRGAYHLHQARAERAAAPLEPRRFYARLVGYPLRREGGLRGVLLTALMGLAQVATAAGWLREAFPRSAAALRRGG